ncbi:MAG: hypothetical protein ACR5KV_01835 [Wolbachia sp.]
MLSSLEEFGALKEKIGAEQFQVMQDSLSNLSKTVEGHDNTIADLTKTVGGQEQAIIICTIATAVAITVIASFVAFCIYQGVKLEKKGKTTCLKIHQMGSLIM